jgi:hypothetical protein
MGLDINRWLPVNPYPNLTIGQASVGRVLTIGESSGSCNYIEGIFFGLSLFAYLSFAVEISKCGAITRRIFLRSRWATGRFPALYHFDCRIDTGRFSGSKSLPPCLIMRLGWSSCNLRIVHVIHLITTDVVGPWHLRACDGHNCVQQ